MGRLKYCLTLKLNVVKNRVGIQSLGLAERLNLMSEVLVQGCFDQGDRYTMKRELGGVVVEIYCLVVLVVQSLCWG